MAQREAEAKARREARERAKSAAAKAAALGLLEPLRDVGAASDERVLEEVVRWCEEQGVPSIDAMIYDGRVDEFLSALRSLKPFAVKKLHAALQPTSSLASRVISPESLPVSFRPCDAAAPIPEHTDHLWGSGGTDTLSSLFEAGQFAFQNVPGPV